MNTARVLVLGGSGFVGRHIVARLAAAGWDVVVPTRYRERAKHLILLPTVDVLEADIHDPLALEQLAAGADAAINLVGILNETRRGDFDRTHVELPRKVVAACHAARVPRLLHMSALNAGGKAPSRYLRSKGEGEALVAESDLVWTIFQPSVIFGREDSFLNLFARLEHFLPVIALARADARFQPFYVGDVADAFVVTPKGLNRQSQLFGDLATEETADTVRLPASRFHQGCQCGTFGAAQHPQDQLQFGLA